jgi:hypothetical protein
MRGVCQGVQARSRRGRGIRWMMLVENGIGGSLCSTVRIDDQRWSRYEASRGENPTMGYMDHYTNARRKKGGNIWRLGIIVPLHPMLRIEYQVLKSTLAGYSEKYRAF